MVVWGKGGKERKAPFTKRTAELLSQHIRVNRVNEVSKNVRGVAAETLGEIGDARAVEPLIEAVKDKDEYVRWAAIETLGEIGDARAVESLIEALKDKDEDVRRVAREALSKIRNKD